MGGGVLLLARFQLFEQIFYAPLGMMERSKVVRRGKGLYV